MDGTCRHCGRSGSEHAKANTNVTFWASSETVQILEKHTYSLRTCPGFSSPDPQQLEDLRLLEKAAKARRRLLGLPEIDYYK